MSDETILESLEVQQPEVSETDTNADVGVEEAQDAESKDTGEVEAKQEKDPWYRRRIDELTRDKHEERRQAERLEKIVEQQDAMLRQIQPQKAAEKPAFAPPNPDDYVGGQFDPRYMQDMMAFTLESAKIEAIEAVKREQQAMMQQDPAMAQQQAAMAQQAGPPPGAAPAPQGGIDPAQVGEIVSAMEQMAQTLEQQQQLLEALGSKQQGAEKTQMMHDMTIKQLQKQIDEANQEMPKLMQELQGQMATAQPQMPAQAAGAAPVQGGMV